MAAHAAAAFKAPPPTIINQALTPGPSVAKPGPPPAPSNTQQRLQHSASKPDQPAHPPKANHSASVSQPGQEPRGNKRPKLAATAAAVEDSSEDIPKANGPAPRRHSHHQCMMSGCTRFAAFGWGHCCTHCTRSTGRKHGTRCDKYATTPAWRPPMNDSSSPSDGEEEMPTDAMKNRYNLKAKLVKQSS